MRVIIALIIATSLVAACSAAPVAPGSPTAVPPASPATAAPTSAPSPTAQATSPASSPTTASATSPASSPTTAPATSAASAPTTVPATTAPGFFASMALSAPAPTQNTTIVATGRLVDPNGQSVPGAKVSANWGFATGPFAQDCGVTDGNGIIICSHDIGAATIGTAVPVDLTFTANGQTYHASASFTPVKS